MEAMEMNETNLAIARKVILCAGLLVAALLLLFPHWRLSISAVIPGEAQAFDQDIGRGFIATPPLLSAASRPTQSTAGAGPDIKAIGVLTMGGSGPVIRINYVRQITEVALALLITFGLMRALRLKRPAED
jgi:hypothetical protein